MAVALLQNDSRAAAFRGAVKCLRNTKQDMRSRAGTPAGALAAVRRAAVHLPLPHPAAPNSSHRAGAPPDPPDPRYIMRKGITTLNAAAGRPFAAHRVEIDEPAKAVLALGEQREAQPGLDGVRSLLLQHLRERTREAAVEWLSGWKSMQSGAAPKHRASRKRGSALTLTRQNYAFRIRLPVCAARTPSALSVARK